MKSSVFENLKPALCLTALAILVAISGCATTNPHARLETAQSEKELVAEKERRIAAEKDRVTAELTEARRSVRDYERERAAQTKAEREALRKKEVEGKIAALKIARDLCLAIEEKERVIAPDCLDFRKSRDTLAAEKHVNAEDYKIAGIADYDPREDFRRANPSVELIVWLNSDAAHAEIQGEKPTGWSVFTEGKIVEIAPKGKPAVYVKVVSFTKQCIRIFEDGRREVCTVNPAKP